MHPQSVLSRSPYFDLHVMAEGVYAAVAREGAGAMSNAGIVDLGGITLVFDTFLTYPAAADLRRAAEELTGRPVQAVVNSHWHGDHVQGNQVFPGAMIFATERTRELVRDMIAAPNAGLNRPGLEQHVQQLTEAIERATDDRVRAGLRSDRDDFSRFLAVYDSTSVVLPNVSVTDRLVVRGSRRQAELLCVGAGHTESDLLLYLPDDGIAFVGDLVAVGNHPWLGHGDPDALVAVHERILALGVHTVIPGHGLPGTTAAVARATAYVRELQALSAELAATNAPDEAAGAVAIPALASDWGTAHMFAENLRFLQSLHLSQME
ncbi:MAG TPA: MBL fold metallo-hydrolase [Symbiobacteriaceae bacterium]|nr:MBL fold metallo-hydrolase [Symbiobacteriaceae bacterium]